MKCRTIKWVEPCPSFAIFYTKKITIIVTVLLATLLLAERGLPATIDNLQRQAIKAYDAGDFKQALDLFSQAVSSEPDDAQALYNQGTALYRLGNFKEAAHAFAASARAHKKSKARARAEYNHGRALMSEAGQSHDLPRKRKLLLDANQAFQQAVADNPRLMAARKGIEDFRQEYAKIKEPPASNQASQGRDQQKQAGQDQKQQDLQNQLNQAGQRQQEMAEQSKEANASQGQQGPSQQQRQEMAKEQQSVRQSLEKLKDELNQNQEGQGGSNQAQQDLTEKLQQAIDEQKKAEESLKKGDLNQAQKHQENAANSLQKSAAQLATNKQEQPEQSAGAAVDNDSLNDETKNNSPTHSQDEVAGQEPESTKTDSTVADILDGEEALHEMRRLRMKQQRPSSGKDW